MCGGREVTGPFGKILPLILSPAGTGSGGRAARGPFEELHGFSIDGVDLNTSAHECAGNRGVLPGDEFASAFKGTQWGRGAIGTAEWTGVRLRDLLEPAGLTRGAREIMPESLDAIRARRPMPLAQAMADDTLVALAMNGEIPLG
jgi:hypothetical protein